MQNGEETWQKYVLAERADQFKSRTLRKQADKPLLDLKQGQHEEGFCFGLLILESLSFGLLNAEVLNGLDLIDPPVLSLVLPSSWLAQKDAFLSPC